MSIIEAPFLKISFLKKRTMSAIPRDEVNWERSAGAVKYTDCISTEGYAPHPLNKFPVYGTKQSEGETPVMLEV